MLDRRVVELAFRIPASRKQSGRQGKTLLRRLAHARLPKGLWRLPKRGFTAPVGSWLSGAYAAKYRDEVLGASSPVGDYLDHRDLARRFEIHGRHESDQSYVLWATWVLDRWLRSAGQADRRPMTLTKEG